MKVGDKVTVNKDIPSVDGMLHKDTIVKIDEISEGSPFRVVDNLGKIWWVNKEDING